MFRKKKTEKEDEPLDLETRLEIAEKKIKMLVTSNDQLITHYVTKKDEFDDIKVRLVKVEKEIEAEKTRGMFA